ncbi:MAG: hypothetical protein RL112_409 [Planctomycetota bacterium]
MAARAIRQGARLAACAALAAFACASPARAGESPASPAAQASAAPGRGARAATIGMPARLDDVRLPGSELEVAKFDDMAPLSLRILSVLPDGEDQFRYAFEWRAFEPGEHDLRGLLRRKDGGSTDGLPPILVRGEAILAATGPIAPAPPRATQVEGVGGYRVWMWIGGALWLAGLVHILRSTRKKQVADARRALPTLADRLRPLVERASRGELDARASAQLEAALVALWRKRLGLEALEAGECLARLRSHAEAGPLLVGLERWLHAPKGSQPVDVASLLSPYQSLDAAEFPLEHAAPPWATGPGGAAQGGGARG